MNILFVNYHDFSSNSAIHIFNFANNLVNMNVDCVVCVPNNKESIHLIGKANFEVFDFNDFLEGKIKFRDGRYPDIIHAWTPREIVREFTEKLAKYYNSKLIVHLEDNEEAILKASYKIDHQQWSLLPEKVVNRIIEKQFSHPMKYKKFLAKADGITVIIDKLLEFKPSPILAKVIWPGYEENLFKPRPIDIELKNKLGIHNKTYVVVYSGNVHHSNKKEVYSLYLAIAALNRKGISVKLVRTGRDFVDFHDAALMNSKESYINLGFVERELLPRIMSIADVFVQPGVSDEFNDYRFPSKLPEFFAMGKPVILPKTNIGRYLSDMYNCILLEQGNSLEICEKLEFVFNNKTYCKQIGDRGKRFASQNFNWSLNTESLLEFYNDVLQNASN
ncbi:glycosyltransferase family 4 protein [Paenibacillus anseongense]|uniref:glycosyltransferase family 4 protein n=1 Tax=Paenibacillus anseongense TaxID=2682845 RepID=UPI002DB73951|nr:glycosyltransferase family 4 protein [Paenibacillus anseongense]MEC0264316.1 glycosyltransferase family 4 protein [Paenibacillus anseongense]